MSTVKLVIETDIFSDVDDVGALALANVFMNYGDAELMAVSVNTHSRWGAPMAQLVNEFYGHDGVPVGGILPLDDSVAERDYAKCVVQRFGHALDVSDAYGVLRDAFTSTSDEKITLVSIGFYQNLVRLLDELGADETSRMVERTVVMAGMFPAGYEFNITEYPAVSQRFVNGWPGEIVFVGWEVGSDVITGGFSNWPKHDSNPVAAAYSAFLGSDPGRPSWDPITVDVAVGTSTGFYDLSEPGWVHVDSDGRTWWEPDENGRHRYVKLAAPIQAVAEHIDSLLSAPPRTEV